jgi:hypothetical protein
MRFLGDGNKHLEILVEVYVFLTSLLDGSEWSASRPGRYTPGERALSYPLNMKLSGPQSQSGGGGEYK